jgi:drug/metabolite transporter (DMT)-like permease
MAEQKIFVSSDGRIDRSRHSALAFLALILGNVAIAFGPLFVRLSDVGPISAGFWRLALALPILWLISRYAGFRITAVPRSILVLCALAGLFFGFDVMAWHIGLTQTKMGNATLFGNAASIMLVIYGVIIARKLPPPMQMAGVLLAFAGAALLMGQSLELSPRNFTGDLLSLLAGVLYCVYLLFMIRVRSSTESWGSLFMASAFAAAVMLAGGLVAGEQVMPSIWWPLVLLAVSSQVAGQGLLTYALPHFSPLIIGLALLLQPALAALAGWYYYDEILTTLDLLGGFMVMAALVIVQFAKNDG